MPPEIGKDNKISLEIMKIYNEEEMKKMCESYGNVKQCYIKPDPSNNKTFLTVTFGSNDEAQSAIDGLNAEDQKLITRYYDENDKMKNNQLYNNAFQYLTHPNTGISGKAMSIMNSFVNDIFGIHILKCIFHHINKF